MSLALLLSRSFSMPTDVANLVVAYAASDKQPWIPVVDPVSGRVARRVVNPAAYPLLRTVLSVHSFGQMMMAPLVSVVYNGVRVDQCRWGITGYESIAASDAPTFLVSFYVILEMPYSNQRDSIQMTSLYSMTEGLYGLVRGTVYRPYLDEWSRESTITSCQFRNDVMYVQFLDIHGEWELDPALNLFDFDAHTPNLWD